MAAPRKRTAPRQAAPPYPPQAEDAPPNPNQGEREFEIGKDEAWAANMKLGYDATLVQLNQVLANLQNHTTQVNSIATQALQNAVETANIVGKQGAAHRDIAIDHQWNIDEQANMAAIVASVTAKVLAEMAGTKK